MHLYKWEVLEVNSEAQKLSGLNIETNAINVIAESERTGDPKSLFWPWCASNISVLGVSYGSWFLGFGVSFWQASLAAILGTAFSFLLVGLVSLAGKHGSAPTMTLSRAAFGINGNKLPGTLSYIALVGWETVLCSLATLATATVFERIGGIQGTSAKLVGFLIVVLLTLGAGVLGFNVIMKVQKIITIATAILTIGYMLLSFNEIKWSAVSALPAGNIQAFIGVMIFGMTGFGLGWVNSGADYSRYLPRSVSSRSVVGWTVLGASIAPIILVIYGALLAGSDEKLNEAISGDPIGALTTILPTWYLLLFAMVAILGLVGGTVLDIYSSGLALISLGFKIPRAIAVGIDGVIMILGTIYMVWFAENFFYPFQGFLITLGVPIAAWAGIFIADLFLRKRGYDEKDLFNSNGRYSSVNWMSVTIQVVASFVGWGLVTNGFASWLSWQGYLLGPIGLGGKEGAWAYSNLGVAAALTIGFIGHWFLGRAAIKQQESA
jgi:purine-cytosine permease-like protein